MRFITTLLVLFVASAAFAVQPQYWVVDSGEEFLAGDLQGMTVTSRGELRPGPVAKRIVSFEEPFVLSQASDGKGTLFVGTGNGGKVYRVNGGKAQVLFTAAEPEIYAVSYRNDSLYVASSPNGKVYRVDPTTGKATTYFDPQQAYIWAVDFLSDGSMAVATGIEGKLFRVTAEGQGKVLFDSTESHIRSLAAAPGGRLLVGGSGEGRIYEVDASGSGRSIYDSTLPEITAIVFDRDGRAAWAAAVANILPASAPPRVDSKPAVKADAAGDTQSEQAPAPQATVTFEDATQAIAASGSTELYRIEPDGFVQLLRRFDGEMIYALSADGEGGVFVSTGPNGRIYHYRNGDSALIATVPEKQAVSFGRSGSGMVVTTTNSGAIYRLEDGKQEKAEYRSVAKDMERFSRFGAFRVEGQGISNGVVSFRSGNNATPDATWSRWYDVKGASGSIAAPAARYLQWRLEVANAPADARVESVSVAYLGRNVAPVIDNLSVLDPGVVIVSSQYPASPQVLEATNPDEHGIFNSLDAPRDRTDPGKRMFRRGYRTIVWKARDENADTLRYNVEFRREGSSKWLRLQDEVSESQVNFDSSQLPDGVYEIRITATDERDNADLPLTSTREDVEFTVDNTSPLFSTKSSGDSVEVTVSDALSPVNRVEYAIDAEKWERLMPADGIADSPRETFVLPRAKTAGKFVVIRAVDSQYNVATTTLDVR